MPVEKPIEKPKAVSLSYPVRVGLFKVFSRSRLSLSAVAVVIVVVRAQILSHIKARTQLDSKLYQAGIALHRRVSTERCRVGS